MAVNPRGQLNGSALNNNGRVPAIVFFERGSAAPGQILERGCENRTFSLSNPRFLRRRQPTRSFSPIITGPPIQNTTNAFFSSFRLFPFLLSPNKTISLFEKRAPPFPSSPRYHQHPTTPTTRWLPSPDHLPPRPDLLRAAPYLPASPNRLLAPWDLAVHPPGVYPSVLLQR